MSEDPEPYGGSCEDHYGEVLKRIRREKRITIVDLAKRMGVSQAYIVRLERGDVQPTQEQIEVIHAFINGRL